jgi:hypothetical protein
MTVSLVSICRDLARNRFAARRLGRQAQPAALRLR